MASTGETTQSFGEVPKEPEDLSYPLNELAIRDERRTAQDVVRRIDNGRFVLDPDFQRDFLWQDTQQSRLIESILMRIPLPVFYVAEDEALRLIVVDGRQRLTTLQHFINDHLSLHLPERPELHGKKFSELDVESQNRVEDCQLHFYIIERTVPERARLDIFERVNSGEPLTRQQMRNALYNGPATIFLRDEAATDLFKNATGEALSSESKRKEMVDREFINRFCAFALYDFSEYDGDLDRWLARALEEMNKPETDLKALGEKFRVGLRNNIQVFGKHAFRKHTSAKQGKNRLNVALFEVMTVALSERSEESVVHRSAELRTIFYGLMHNDRFEKSLSEGTTKSSSVNRRFSIATKAINGVFRDY